MYDEKLVTDNLALAKYVAKKYIQSGLEYDDLLQVAYEGLVLAAARYDPSKGFAFSTFAVCCMDSIYFSAMPGLYVLTVEALSLE